MSETKEQILNTALKLFARDGYEAVSVSVIAGELGMTKGALYKHYKNKRDIFDSIVKRMYEIDNERAREYGVPEETYDAAAEEYKNTSSEDIMAFTMAQFRFWTENEFASNFRKMLTVEQYRNTEMSELYTNCIGSGPVLYMEDIFREMINNGKIKGGNARQYAIEFYAPLHLLINLSEHTQDMMEFAKILKNHIDRFMERIKR